MEDDTKETTNGLLTLEEPLKTEKDVTFEIITELMNELLADVCRINQFSHQNFDAEFVQQVADFIQSSQLNTFDEYSENSHQILHSVVESTSTATTQKNKSLTDTHDLSVIESEFKLTESELQLGKTRPYWIPDEDCCNCMICSSRFSIFNRRHHCRSCGRVLCRSCCFHRRTLSYLNEKEGKLRICTPCNKWVLYALLSY